MRVLREALLSLFVMGVVLYLYVVAAGATLVSLCGFGLKTNKAEDVHHSRMAANVNLMSRDDVKIPEERSL